jgi:hypothetical protein
MCAAADNGRKSIGAGPPTAGEGADALYLCLLSLLMQPGDRDLQQRLGMSKLNREMSRDVTEVTAADNAAAAAAPVNDIVVMLLSKLEPSGILDRFAFTPVAPRSELTGTLCCRWPAFSCALFLRLFDALIISSQASAFNLLPSF